ncbi:MULTISPECIES: hypothetical protein [unclassified Pseudomonas]|uniref:hypothetical protein n=1 Tax=unclassified Pseudomonas TaxID=196821 RepID=UPI000BC6904D|nr:MULTISPECIES: hypothetical protein [unclassified Pseudomonas]PVZ19945.1 hypothetical protein F474_00536 [Pseudomonas sp. URIL14HWK12:I12]PVZ27011.1 hypothetical protein F470_00191 [Pseudomonas sp. URIL14HWK12:I10]PVZ37900.1 hypothetical protein F472_00536 [Pseudomonas sp. URIL14HWK12:I11]SNZ05218.1 hypothetical protein SAMN05660463_00868 [Pseudomonas sp. URIL14HWK12:I9]
MPLTTRQIVAMRNISQALKTFYKDCDCLTTDFISPAWIAVIDDRTALICESCDGEGRVGWLTPDGFDDGKCHACGGSGLKPEVRDA